MSIFDYSSSIIAAGKLLRHLIIAWLASTHTWNSLWNFLFQITRLKNLTHHEMWLHKLHNTFWAVSKWLESLLFCLTFVLLKSELSWFFWTHWGRNVRIEKSSFTIFSEENSRVYAFLLGASRVQSHMRVWTEKTRVRNVQCISSEKLFLMNINTIAMCNGI